MSDQHLMIKRHIKTYPDWPVKGVNFKDLSSLYLNNTALHQCAHRLIERYLNSGITHVAVLEARAFILGSIVAFALNVPIIMIRKPGKLAGNVLDSQIREAYTGLQMQQCACQAGDHILIFDDLIASGASALAAIDLIQQQQAHIAEVACIAAISELSGVQKLGAIGVPVFNLCSINA